MDKKKTKNLLDSLTPEEIEKLQKYKESRESPYPLDDYWMTLADIALTFGWEAYIDAKHDNVGNVTGKEMYTLLAAAKKLKVLDIDNMVQAGLTVNQISYAKNPKTKYQNYINKLKSYLRV